MFASAQICWIPGHIKDLYGDDPLRVQEHLSLHPALRECTPRLSQPLGKVEWSSPGLGLGLEVEWLSGSPPLMLHDKRSLDDLGVVSYKAADDFVVTPAIGSMSTGLHPFLALWAVLLGLFVPRPVRTSCLVQDDRHRHVRRGQCRREPPR